jgi:hypothetical protein
MDLQIINMLNNMYNNNSIQLDRLISSNNEIIRIIQNILNQYLSNPNRPILNPNRPILNPNIAENNSRTRPTSTTFTERNLLNISIPELYNNSFILDYQDTLSTEQITELLQTFLNPIIISPTQSEINNATSLIRFDEIENPLNNSCPISLEPFQQEETITIIKYCGHLFKTNEIQHWFTTNVRCPVCRYDIRNFINRNETNNSTSFHQNTRNQENLEISNNNRSEERERTDRTDRINRTNRTNRRSIPNLLSNNNNSRGRLDNFLLNLTINDLSYNHLYHK